MSIKIHVFIWAKTFKDLNVHIKIILLQWSRTLKNYFILYSEYIFE